MKSKMTVAVLLAGLLCIAPFASAQTTTEPLRVGPGLLNIGITLQEDYSDNLFLSSGPVDENPDILYAIPTPKESDWWTTIRPEIQYGLPMQDFMLEVHGLYEWIRYQDFDSQDAENWLVGASLGADFASGLSFQIGDNYEEQLLNANQEFGVEETLKLNEAKAYLGFNLGERLRLTGEFFNYTYDYERSDDRDRIENVLAVTFFWRVRPRTSLLLEYDYGDFNYDDNPTADNQAHQVQAGVTWEATGRSTGVAKFGYQWKEYDIDQIEPLDESRSTDSWVATLDWQYRMTSRTSTVLGLRREFLESSFFANPNYIRNGIRGDLTHRFTQKLWAAAHVDLHRDTYPNEVPRGLALAEREDDAYELGLRAGFDVFDWLTLAVQGTTGTRDSSFNEFDWDENTVTFLVRAGYGTVRERLRRTE